MGGISDFSPSNVYQPGYAQQTRKTLEAQINLAPQLFQANAQFQPLYNALNLQDVNQFLMGTPEQTYQTQVWQPPKLVWQKDKGGGGLFGSGGILGGFNPDLAGLGPDLEKHGSWHKVPVGTGKYVPGEVKTAPAQRGFLDLLQNEIQPALLRAQSAQRSADIADVARLGPEAIAAMKAANPAAAALIDEITKQAGSELDLGGTLSPDMRAVLERSVREGQAARGGGFSPADTYQEALQMNDAGEALKASRRAFAESAVGQNQSYYGDLFRAILNRDNAAGSQNLAGQALGASRMGSLFNPESSYAQNVYDTSFNARQSTANATASNNAAITGALISAIGSIAGGATKAFAA